MTRIQIWREEYIRSLKYREAEDISDRYVARPLAFLVVKFLFRLPLTPNHYSLLALMSGWAGAYFFYQGTWSDFRIGACFIFLFTLFDCCDGMQARLKKNGSPLGEITDALVDFLAIAPLILCLGLGMDTLHKRGQLTWTYLPSLTPLFVVAISGILTGFHVFLFDYVQRSYSFARKARENQASASLSAQKIPGFLGNLQFEFQANFSANVSLFGQSRLMRLVSVIGGPSHLFILAISTASTMMDVWFFYVFIFCQVYILGLALYVAIGAKARLGMKGGFTTAVKKKYAQP